MAVKVGINGFGRIGKCVVRAAINNPDVEVVAINATGDNEGTALLLKYDSVHGTIPNEVTFDDENIYVDGKKIRVFHDRDASKLPCSAFNFFASASIPARSAVKALFSSASFLSSSANCVSLLFMKAPNFAAASNNTGWFCKI